MGIATGILREGVSPAASAVLELAKLVSDAGAGGQILMCLDTFKAVKEMVGELGGINEEGLSEVSSPSSVLSCLPCLRCEPGMLSGS